MPSPNPRLAPSTLDRVKTISDIVSVWVGLVALLFGGIFAMIQYLDKERADQVKYSLDFLQKFNSPPVIEARKAVLAAWTPNRGRLTTALAKYSSEPQAYPNVVSEVIETKNLNDPLITLFDFYESLQICVETRVCEASTSSSLFQRDARMLFQLHFPFIEEQRKILSDDQFGQKLEIFAMGK